MYSALSQLQEIEDAYEELLESERGDDRVWQIAARIRLYRAAGEPFGASGNAVMIWSDYRTGATRN